VIKEIRAKLFISMINMNSQILQNFSSHDYKLFITLFIISFSIFVFTNDGHRYTIDEDIAQQQTLRLSTLEPHPNYIEGSSGINFEFEFYKWKSENSCNNAIICSAAYIGHSLTELPFVLINQNLNIIEEDTVTFSYLDFNDPHYVYWRNNLNPDFTFMELFFGPFFSALSVGILFLVCRTFYFSPKISLSISFLYGFSTTIWAFSQTSFNHIPETFFLLLGFLFFRKFQKSSNSISLIFSGSSLGFAYLIRPDAILIIGPLLLFLIYHVLSHNKKIQKLTFFISSLAITEFSVLLIICIWMKVFGIIFG